MNFIAAFKKKIEEGKIIKPQIMNDLQETLNDAN